MVCIPVGLRQDATPIQQLSRSTAHVLTGHLGNASVLMHPVDPMFAVTFNKLQGQTVSRLLLVLHDLSKPKLGAMTLNKLYVAISRVQSYNHWAILKPTSHEKLRHLTRLQFHPSLQAWHYNYEADGSWKSDPIWYLPALIPSLHRLLATTSFDDLPLRSLQKIAKHFALTYRRHSAHQLRDAITAHPLWIAYLSFSRM
jgi:hypothetical protein